MRGSNYNHLYYFWMIAKEGTIQRASEHLHLTPQTVSGQLRVLEDSLGETLFERAGRRLVLTETGQLVFTFADEIFRLGAEMQEALRGRRSGQPLQFSVGIVDVVPKMVAYRLLEPALRLSEPVRLVCREGKLDLLLGELALHKLDMVLADSPLGSVRDAHVFNHTLGECGISFFATPALAHRYRAHFPRSLHEAPMLVPAVNTALRGALMQWLDQSEIRPRIVGEFEDRALMQAFGQAGVGIFMSPSVIAAETERQYSVEVIGATQEVRERYYAISTERRLRHPAVVAVTQTARLEIFPSPATVNPDEGNDTPAHDPFR